MPKKKRPTSKSARGRKISTKLKMLHAQAKQIHKEEPELTYREAFKKVPKTFIDAVNVGEGRVAEYWIARDPHDPEGSPYRRWVYGTRATWENTEGPERSFGDVVRAVGVSRYWSLVKLLARKFDLSIQKTRELVTEAKAAMVEAEELFGKWNRRGGKAKKFRTRDVVAMLWHSDRYPKLRAKYGI